MFRRTFADAKAGELYSAREFNRLKNTLSDLTGHPTFLRRGMLPVRHAITHNGGGTYPAFSAQPDTYAVKWVHLTYTAAAGKNGYTLTYWDGASVSPVNASSADDYVHNIARWGTSGDLYSPYIPEGTLIECYYNQGSWFTEWWAQGVLYKGTLTADLDALDATGTINTLQAIEGPDLGLSTITFQNIWGEAASSGAICVVYWNATAEQWELLKYTCP